MKKENKSELEYLQDARDNANGPELVKAQRKIDDYFMKNPPKNRNKKRKRFKARNDDDLWW